MQNLVFDNNPTSVRLKMKLAIPVDVDIPEEAAFIGTLISVNKMNLFSALKSIATTFNFDNAHSYINSIWLDFISF